MNLAINSHSNSRRTLLKTAVMGAAAGVAAACIGPEAGAQTVSKKITKSPQTNRIEPAMSRGGLSRARLARMHDVMAAHIERGVPGLVTLISRRGEVIVDAIGMKAVNGNDPKRRDTIFRIASMSKPITAAATMILVEECKLRLDEPVDRLLPELANRKVLKQLDSPIDETVPAKRPITARDLLTFRMGFGFTLELFSGDYPIVKAMRERQLAIGPIMPAMSPDEYMRRLGSMPLMFQPGERWSYQTGSDVLGVLIARASGKTFETFLRERIFERLGMKDTGFSVPPENLDRLPAAYQANSQTRKLELFDDPRTGKWSRPPLFPSGGGGLVSTVDDYLSFGRMMLNMGKHGDERILSRPSVELMTTDQITTEQKAGSFLPDGSGWGFGVSVVGKRNDLFATPGRYGWDGGYGTSWASDPKEEMVGILMTQRLLDAPSPPPVFVDFWTSAYAAIDD
jgi:CubicO group peptidase (beta-lactamase class C family)